MRRLLPPALAVLLAAAPSARAYVEVPHTLGRCVHDSTNVVLVEVTKVNKEKGLIVYKKVQDLKGKHPGDEIKHNIGQNGFHPREWQNVMNWAAEGKKAVFFHNGGASETCIGTYWYQCYKGGDWWGMSHAEPFLLRTYCGDPEKLAAAVVEIVAGKEVVVSCFADGNKEQLHQRKGKLQRLKASLKRLEYDAKRDFVAWGGDGDEIEEFKTTLLVAESTPGWKFASAAKAAAGDRWRLPDFDDKGWSAGKAPIGYGEEEIAKRQGTALAQKTEAILFRRAFDVPEDLLRAKGVTFRLCVASDNSATVFLNGEQADHEDGDHEFSYWNRDVELPAKLLKPGRNVVAVVVRNGAASSDLFFDAEVSASVPLPKPSKKPAAAPGDPAARPAAAPRADDRNDKVTVDRATKSVNVECAVAPRKLPNLNQVYPLEVIATYPAPEGQKAHETVVTFKNIKPSAVHKALEELGLKPGKPAKGEGAKAEGPEVRIYLELPGADGKPVKHPIEKLLVDGKSGKPLPPVKWHFTGSVTKQPDPEKGDKVYGADLSGTLIALFPVTDETVIQTNLTMKDEPLWKLEIVKDALPKEGTPVKLIIEVK